MKRAVGALFAAGWFGKSLAKYGHWPLQRFWLCSCDPISYIARGHLNF